MNDVDGEKLDSSTAKLKNLITRVCVYFIYCLTVRAIIYNF